MKRYEVVVIPGDGIGPELTDAAVGVIRAVAASGGFEMALDRARGRRVALQRRPAA